MQGTWKQGQRHDRHQRLAQDPDSASGFVDSRAPRQSSASADRALPTIPSADHDVEMATVPLNAPEVRSSSCHHKISKYLSMRFASNLLVLYNVVVPALPAAPLVKRHQQIMSCASAVPWQMLLHTPIRFLALELLHAAKAGRSAPCRCECFSSHGAD